MNKIKNYIPAFVILLIYLIFSFAGIIFFRPTYVESARQYLKGAVEVDANTRVTIGDLTTSSMLRVVGTTPPDIIIDNTTTSATADSGDIVLRGNTWESTTDVEIDMRFRLNCEDTSDDYDINIYNDGGSTCVAQINQSGRFIGTGLDASDGTITNVGNIALDSISSDAGTTISVTLGSDAGDDFKVDTTSLVVEGDNNRVGIGTAAPTTTLDVSGDARITNTLSLNDTGITNVGNIALDSISSDAGTTISVTLGTDAGDDFKIGDGSAYFFVAEGDTEDVAIGDNVSDPACTLDVSGDARVAGSLTVNGINYGADTGNDDTYAITLSPAPTAYAGGMIIVLDVSADNTGACTLNVNGLGAKDIKLPNGSSDPPDSHIDSDGLAWLAYSSNGGEFIILSPDANP